MQRDGRNGCTKFPASRKHSSTAPDELVSNIQTGRNQSMPLDSSVTDVISQVIKKTYVVDGLENYHIIMKKHDLIRVLTPPERPLLMQKRLLQQVGYLSIAKPVVSSDANQIVQSKGSRRRFPADQGTDPIVCLPWFCLCLRSFFPLSAIFFTYLLCCVFFWLMIHKMRKGTASC